jgi:hypothetical protein
VLADGKISRGEYDQAVSKYVRCVDDHGIPLGAELQPPLDLTYQYSLPGGGDNTSQAVMDRCAVGTTALIEPLYAAQVQNPHKVDLDQLTAQCLVRKGVAPKGYTGAAYARDSDSAHGGRFPFNPDDPRIAEKYSACMEAPAQ